MLRENKKGEPTVFVKQEIHMSGSQIMTPKLSQKRQLQKSVF